MLRGTTFAALVLLVAAPAQAIPPDRLDQYQLVPRHSTLLRTGGFAGETTRFRLIGEYGFAQEWNTDTVGLWPTARFVEPEIWGAQIVPPGVFIPTIVEDVDELLNLEGLLGRLLPLGAPLDVYHFRGSLQDTDATSPLENSTIDLYAALQGPWMYLYGETTPPPGSADFYQYQIKALARTRPWADLNDDGRVDAADYTMARDHHPERLQDWASQYGEEAPDAEAMFTSLSAAMASANAVPEPSALVLLLLAFTPAPGTRRSGCRP